MAGEKSTSDFDDLPISTELRQKFAGSTVVSHADKDETTIVSGGECVSEALRILRNEVAVEGLGEGTVEVDTTEPGEPYLKEVESPDIQ